MATTILVVAPLPVAAVFDAAYKGREENAVVAIVRGCVAVEGIIFNPYDRESQWVVCGPRSSSEDVFKPAETSHCFFVFKTPPVRQAEDIAFIELNAIKAKLIETKIAGKCV